MARDMNARQTPSVWFTALAVGFGIMMVPGRASAQRPMGTDVSGYQPSINWTTVKNAGVSFAWTKATEGTSYRNPYFEAQEWGATNVGIYIGAYHFARPFGGAALSLVRFNPVKASYYWAVARGRIRGWHDET